MKTAWRTIDPLGRFLSKWLAAAFVLALITFILLPFNDLKFTVPLYHLETVLWFALSLISGVALYYSSFPEKAPAWPKYCFVSFFSILVGLTFNHASITPHLLQEAALEMDLWRGRCGFLIGLLSMGFTTYLFRWSRQGAPRSPRVAGLWAAFSAASLGCFLMQPVCLHDSSMHLLIWHFLPVMGISLIGAETARFILKW